MTLLLDFGIFGFLIYVAPLAYLLYVARSFETVVMVFSIIFINSMLTFSYGVVGGFMYWTIVSVLFKEVIADRKRLNKAVRLQ